MPFCQDKDPTHVSEHVCSERVPRKNLHDDDLIGVINLKFVNLVEPTLAAIAKSGYLDAGVVATFFKLPAVAQRNNPDH